MNKYNSRKIQADGETFDSAKEYRRWQALKLMEKASIINNLQRQVPFELIPTQREPDTTGPRGGIKRGKVIEKGCTYVADFTYWKNGEFCVEDVKGYKGGGAYAVFSIKRKLMLQVHGIRVKEV